LWCNTVAPLFSACRAKSSSLGRQICPEIKGTNHEHQSTKPWQHSDGATWPIPWQGHELNKPAHFKFRLYVAGDGPNSSLAIANLGAICRDYLPDRHEIETVDVIQDPQRALADGVSLTPLLIKLAPAPTRKLIGNLSQLKPTLMALGLTE
jgi:circadian clock protein KaiB